MIVDSLNLFAENASTGNVGTNILGNVMDIGTSRDIGTGQPLYVNAQVTTGITAGSAGTYVIKLTSASDAALSSGAVDHVVSASVATSTTAIAAGTVLLNAALPAGTYGRYIGIREVVGTANTTAGKVSAFLSNDQISWTAYAGAK